MSRAGEKVDTLVSRRGREGHTFGEQRGREGHTLVSREGGKVTALVSRWDAEGECFLSPRRGAGQSCRPYQQQGPLHIKGNVTVTGQGNVTGTGQGERDGHRTERRDGHRTGQGRGGQGVGVDRRVGNLSSDRWDKEGDDFLPRQRTDNGQCTTSDQRGGMGRLRTRGTENRTKADRGAGSGTRRAGGWEEGSGPERGGTALERGRRNSCNRGRGVGEGAKEQL